MANIHDDEVSRQKVPDRTGIDPLYMAAAAVRRLRHGQPPNVDYCTTRYLGPYEPLITAMRQELDQLRGQEVAVIASMMTDLWHANREDPKYAELRAHVDLMDNDDTAELGAGAPGHGPHTPPLLCPPLPTHPEEDEDLMARCAADASPWLDAYINFSRTWAPRAFEHFHEACGLFVLSTTVARRVRIALGRGVYPSLYQALVSRTTLWSKTTAAEVALGLLRQAGLTHLLCPDDATPQAFLRALVAQLPDDYADLGQVRRTAVLRRLAFAAQRGWFYEEFGQHLAAMMQRDGVMAAFRGILRRFDDHKEDSSYETIARGLEDITKPYLSLLATLTPADLKPFAHAKSSLWGDGYFARFAFIAAPMTGHSDARYPKGRLTYPVELTKPLHDWHERLGLPTAEAYPVPDAKQRPSGRWRLVPATLPETTYTLSDTVWEAFYRYDGDLRRRISEAEHQALDGSYGRFAIKALRIAGLLASLQDQGTPPSRTIELRHWYRAQAIAERWRASLHRLVNQLEDDIPGESREQTVELRLERALRRGGAQSIRQLHLRTNASYGEINKAITTLLTMGVVLVDEEASQRTTKYRLITQSPNGDGTDEP